MRPTSGRVFLVIPGEINVKENAKKSVIPSCLCLLLGAWVSNAALAQAEPVTVQVAVNDTETALDIRTPSQCGGSSEMGCIEAPYGQRIRIQVVLGGDEECSTGGRWQLSGVFLGGEGSPTKPSDWGGLDRAAEDFDVDPATGRVTPETGSTGTQLKFIDRNQENYDVWYKVEASCGDRVIETDPRIRNGGGG